MTLKQFKRSERVAVVAHQRVTKTGRREMGFVCPARTDAQRAFVHRESHPP